MFYIVNNYSVKAWPLNRLTQEKCPTHLTLILVRGSETAVNNQVEKGMSYPFDTYKGEGHVGRAVKSCWISNRKI